MKYIETKKKKFKFNWMVFTIVAAISFVGPLGNEHVHNIWEYLVVCGIGLTLGTILSWAFSYE